MSKGIFYIGVDVGQEELWVAIEGHKPHSFTHTVAGAKELWNWIRKRVILRQLCISVWKLPESIVRDQQPFFPTMRIQRLALSIQPKSPPFLKPNSSVVKLIEQTVRSLYQNPDPASLQCSVHRRRHCYSLASLWQNSADQLFSQSFSGSCRDSAQTPTIRNLSLGQKPPG